jgi:hypothetical protein
VKDLRETNPVVRWPAGKPVPKCGDRIDAGMLGQGIVVTVQQECHNDYRKLGVTLVELRLFWFIENVPISKCNSGVTSFQ